MGCESGPVISGKCWTMCPYDEIRFREVNHLLTIFETLDGTHRSRKPKADPSKCVKEFRRSAAGEVINNPKYLRPGSVLLKTVDYLYREVIPRTDVPFARVYDYVFDRLRSVRQDMVIQQLHRTCPQTAVLLLEKCYRFYTYSLFMMKLHTKMPIDAHINKTHMLECLNTAVELYAGICDRSQDCYEDVHRNSVEFLSCYLLCNIHSEEALCYVMSSFSKSVRETEPLRTTLDLSFAQRCRNYVRVYKDFVKLLHNGWYLTAFSYLGGVDAQRTEAIMLLSHSHNSKVGSIPPTVVAKWMLLDDTNDVKTLAVQHGMDVNAAGNIVMSKACFVVPQSLHISETLLLCFCSDSRNVADMILLA